MRHGTTDGVSASACGVTQYSVAASTGRGHAARLLAVWEPQQCIGGESHRCITAIIIAATIIVATITAAEEETRAVHPESRVQQPQDARLLVVQGLQQRIKG